MSFDRVIICIMALFAILGGIDRIFGNRLGLGKAFEEGISTMGAIVSFTIPLAMSALSGEMRGDAARGILWGVVTVPIGVIFGRLSAGFSLQLGKRSG